MRGRVHVWIRERVAFRSAVSAGYLLSARLVCSAAVCSRDVPAERWIGRVLELPSVRPYITFFVCFDYLGM